MRPGRAKASGDKRYEFMLVPFQGVSHRCTIPQGVALGYELLPLQGEALNTEMRKLGGMETRRRGDTEVWRYGGKYYVFEDTESFLELRDSVTLCLF